MIIVINKIDADAAESRLHKSIEPVWIQRSKKFKIVDPISSIYSKFSIYKPYNKFWKSLVIILPLFEKVKATEDQNEIPFDQSKWWVELVTNQHSERK